MKYMLDTNICIYLIKKKPITVIHRLEKTNPSDVCISSITLSELEYGVEKSEKKDQNRAALLEFIVPLEVVAYGENAAAHYGKIRSFMEKAGKLIGPLDMLIASHALALNRTVVTNNTKEFHRVPDLKVENWTL